MVPDSPRKAGPYAVTSTSLEFPFSFYMLSGDDVVVTISDANGKDFELDRQYYSVTLNSPQKAIPGGVVVLKQAIDSMGTRLVISSDVKLTQELDLHNSGNFSPTVINKEEDRRVIQIQQLAEKLSRALLVPITSSTTREEMLEALLDTAAKANEYAELAKQVYDEVLETQKEVDAAKNDAKISADSASLSADSAANSAAQVAADKTVAQELLAQAQETSTEASNIAEEAIIAAEEAIAAKQTAVEAANSAGFSYRYCASIEANGTAYLGLLAPNTNVKIGDHVLNNDGVFFEIVALTEEQFTVGEVVTILKGEKGDTGPGLDISDAFNSEEELLATLPTGEKGQTVLVGGTVYTWSESASSWVASEVLQGPAGPAGESANDILMTPDPVKYFDEIYGKTDLVTGDLVVDISGTDPSAQQVFEENLTEVDPDDTTSSGDALVDIFDATLGQS